MVLHLTYYFLKAFISFHFNNAIRTSEKYKCRLYSFKSNRYFLVTSFSQMIIITTLGKKILSNYLLIIISQAIMDNLYNALSPG